MVIIFKKEIEELEKSTKKVINFRSCWIKCLAYVLWYKLKGYKVEVIKLNNTERDLRRRLKKAVRKRNELNERINNGINTINRILGSEYVSDEKLYYFMIELREYLRGNDNERERDK